MRRGASCQTLGPMCVQCMMGAMTAGAGATGVRAVIAARRPAWLSPAALRVITVALLFAALVASTVLLGGSGQHPAS